MDERYFVYILKLYYYLKLFFVLKLFNFNKRYLFFFYKFTLTNRFFTFTIVQHPVFDIIIEVFWLLDMVLKNNIYLFKVDYKLNIKLLQYCGSLKFSLILNMKNLKHSLY